MSADFRQRHLSHVGHLELESPSRNTGTAKLLAEDNPDAIDCDTWSNDSSKVSPSPARLSKLKLLAKYYRMVKHHFLQYQSPTLGLFCTDTSHFKGPRIKSGRTCHVRENIYCAYACWALGQAYRLVDNDGGRTHELEQSAIKCMRGILFCWMRQSENLERFKLQQIKENALHSMFDALTGDSVEDSESYHHLQLDVQGLFLLILVQFISSGLQVIYTKDEVLLVQNIVYYIERSYRVSDYGIWERGTKYNTGEPELHASSLGMTKAALEAINGFNLMGDKGSSSDIIYVDLDAHCRNTQTFSTLLPRESSSKNTDMALLTSIGFPAFAIDSNQSRDATNSKVIRKLQGHFGLKRYLRDGFGCDNEGLGKLYYDPSEIHNFDGIECQWPMGFVMLYLNALFAGDLAEAKKYYDLVDPLLLADDAGMDVLPKYYFVEACDFETERKHPNSSSREHSGEGTDGKLYLMGQALFFISKLLAEGLVQPNQLDPIGRYQTRGRRFKHLKHHVPALIASSSRYSRFQVKAPRELCVQVCVIAQTTRLQSLLTTYGILSQTPHQIEPVQICAPSELVRAYDYLGRNAHLGLSGRPHRPFGALSTSKTYKIRGRTVVSYPLVFQLSDFYTALDMPLLVEDVRELIRFVWSSWCVSGRPLICCILREDIFGSDQAAVGELLNLLTSFRRGTCNGVPVKLGRMQTFISACCCECLDFLSENDCSYKFEPSLFSVPTYSKELFTESNLTATTSDSRRTTVRKASSRQMPKDIDTYSTRQILDKLYESPESLQFQCELLTRLLQREGKNFKTSQGTVGECLEQVIHIAAGQHYWSLVRHCSGLLGKTVDSLAPAITNIIVSGRFVTIGIFGRREALIITTLTPRELHELIFDCCNEPTQAVLQQEILICCGKMVQSRPELFKGMLKIRIGWIIESMKQELAKSQPTVDFHSLSPRQMKALLQDVLEIDVSKRSVSEQRSIDGSLNRAPLEFHDKVWTILERCPKGVRLGQFSIPQQPTLSEMTNYDRKFAMLVEDMLRIVKNPKYRQILVEMVMIAHTVFERNPELKCREVLNFDELMDRAIASFANDHSGLDGFPKYYRREDAKNKDTWYELFYNVSPHVKNGTVKYMATALITQLLDTELDVSTMSSDMPCHIQ